MPIQLHNTKNTSVAFGDSDCNNSRRFYGYVVISERMNEVPPSEKVPFYIVFLTYVDLCKLVLISYINKFWNKFILSPGSDSEQNRNVWQKSKILFKFSYSREDDWYRRTGLATLFDLLKEKMFNLRLLLHV